MRSSTRAPRVRAASQTYSAFRTCPRWSQPVGAGANRVITPTGYFLTVSLPLTGIPQTVPAYVTTIFAPAASGVAVPFGNENGQLTPP